MILIDRRKITDRIEVSFFDLSRPLAGDRWLLELRCEAKTPIREDWRAEAPETAASLGEHLTFATTKVRHFVDQGEKTAVLQELQKEMEATLFPYLTGPAFPLRLWQRACQEWQQQRQHPIPPVTDHEDPEDDGPADFSAIFAAPG